ncbi:MAG TPA: LPS export ABC transporter periplasmic protein LptC [Longimicrobiales bacterium]|nr:LPS export ABC transporter periplasmic protein LptC [Longimicrobiales bacterium]
MRTMLLTAFVAAGVAACGGGTGPVTSDYTPLPADQVLEGVEHIMTSAGVRQSVLRSDSTLVFDDSSAVHLRGVHLDMFTETGGTYATLTSQRGRLDQSTNRMVAMGDVELVIHEGSNAGTIRTEELHYDPDQRIVWSDVHTERIWPGGQTGSMDSFRVDDRFGNFTMQGYRGYAPQIRF